MTPEILLVLVIVLGLIIVFTFELLPIDTIGLLLIVVFMVAGLVEPVKAISGFSNEAVITILALMIIGAGLEETGAVQLVGIRLKWLFFLKEWQSIGLLMLLVAIISAFINTTIVVIIFLSIVLKIAEDLPTRLSKLLIPISFAGILGGSCSLMGTSTNLLVSSISEEKGYGAFGFFEFSLIGVVVFLVALIYMVLVGRHLLPQRESEKFSESPDNDKIYLTKIFITEESKFLNKSTAEIDLFKNGKAEALYIEKAEDQKRTSVKGVHLEPGDAIIVNIEAGVLKGLLKTEKIQLVDDFNLNKISKYSGAMTVCEILIKPGANIVGESIREVDIWKQHGIIPLAIHKLRKTKSYLERSILGQTLLKQMIAIPTFEVGDSVLILCPKAKIEAIQATEDFVILHEYREIIYQKSKIFWSATILLGVILLAAFKIVPILVSALAGAVMMVLTNCISLHKAYKQVDWSIIFLLAGMIPISLAMKNTGADNYLAEWFLEVIPSHSPFIVIASMFLLSAVLTSIISNNATAILLAPIAITLAISLEFPPKPLLFSVMFGANTSYFTPIGYQTNALIYNTGNYKFTDFIKVGGPLSLIIWLVASKLIHLMYF